MRKLALLLFLGASLLGQFATPMVAAPYGHQSASRSHTSNDRPKTVRVRPYTKKNGTYVQAHNRAKPQR